jgi:hypothetical protein
MGRVLRKGTSLGDITLLSDAEVVDIWPTDNAFAGWCSVTGNLLVHEGDLHKVIEIDGQQFMRTYSPHAVMELTPVPAEVVEAPVDAPIETPVEVVEVPAEVIEAPVEAKPKPKVKKGK